MNDTDWLRKRMRNPLAGCLLLLLPALGLLAGSAVLLSRLSLAYAAAR